jgi:hypothetical protein
MLKLTETKGIEGQFGMAVSFVLAEPDVQLNIDNEAQVFVEFVLRGDLGAQ